MKDADDLRIDLVRLRRQPERHAQEVLHVAERVVGVEQRMPDRGLVGVRGDRRQLGDEADARQVDLLRVERVEAVLVDGPGR
jgi:hypothetical protein